MASPFSIFRKYQATLLAVFGVALMVAFVVLPAVMQMQQLGGGGGRGSQGVVMTWVGGNVTGEKLQSQGRVNSLTLDFLRAIGEQARRIDPQAKLPDDAQAVARLLGDTSPGGVVRIMLLSHKASEAGIVVSDDAIYRFLMLVSDNVLDKPKIDAVYQSWAAGRTQSTGPAPPLSSLFDALRTTLMAYEMDKLARAGLAVTSPADAWEYHNRINRRITAEFVPFTVTDYVSKVTGEPTSAELTKLYDEHKYQDPNPDSPEPGFHVPMKVDFHYFVANRDKFVQEEKGKVTRQQIEEYYQERKNNFRIPEDFGVVDEVDESDPRQATPRPPQPEVQDGRVEGAADPRDANPTPPAVDDDEAVPPNDADATPGGCEDELPADDDAEAPDTTDEAGGDEAPPATDPAGTDGETDDPIVDTQPKEPKYKPLEEVEDEIRSAIAGEMADPRIDEAVRQAIRAVKDFEDRRLNFELGDAPDPGKFNHAAVAKKLGIESGETGLVSMRELYENEDLALGRSSRAVEGAREPQYFLSIGYREGLQLYQPIQTQVGGEEEIFVSWKVAEEEARVPELADIRAEVVKAWKLDEARKLAQQAAEKLAAEVDGGKLLKEQVPAGTKVITPRAFSYVEPISMMMVRFGQARMPRLDEIEFDIEDSSTDTIKKEVVKMPVGGVEVLPNASKSIYYVVHVVSDVMDEEESRQKFIQDIVDNPLGEGPPLEGFMVSGRDLSTRNPIDVQPYFDWYRQLEEEYDVKRVDEEYFRQNNNRDG